MENEKIKCCPSWNNILSAQNNHLNLTKQKHSSAEVNNLLDFFEKREHTFEVHSDETQKQGIQYYPQYFASAVECATHLPVKEGINMQDIVKILMIFLKSQKYYCYCLLLFYAW